ncbi:MAG: CPBP family intramembrane metalloprotease [Chloroflexi bacterium]|nr:CPBP family intramembrane metalloprotease [Chloroflexota bacterium]
MSHAPTALAPDDVTHAHPSGFSTGSAAGVALGLALLIVVAEYLARHVLAPILPLIGAPMVNDMLASALCYGLLILVTAAAYERTPAVLGRALLDVFGQSWSWLALGGGVAFLLLVVILMPLDVALWGSVTLPSYSAPPSDVHLLTGLATPLTIAALMTVNGIVIPLAEERLWRGMIQPRLLLAWGILPALLTTAFLFSLKHAIVDASLGRLLALFVGGLALGYVAHRAGGGDGGRLGWRVTAISHMLANLAATGLILIVQGV